MTDADFEKAKAGHPIETVEGIEAKVLSFDWRGM